MEKILDDNYMHILYDHQDLDLQTVFLLDRVQKGLSLDKADVDKLRAAKLVEGRITSLFLSASASKSMDDSAGYIKNKGFNDKYYKDLIVEYLKNIIRQNVEILSYYCGKNYRILCLINRRKIRFIIF